VIFIERLRNANKNKVIIGGVPNKFSEIRTDYLPNSSVQLMAVSAR
jgi:hypothetical protein